MNGVEAAAYRALAEAAQEHAHARLLVERVTEAAIRWRRASDSRVQAALGIDLVFAVDALLAVRDESREAKIRRYLALQAELDRINQALQQEGEGKC